MGRFHYQSSQTISAETTGLSPSTSKAARRTRACGESTWRSAANRERRRRDSLRGQGPFPQISGVRAWREPTFRRYDAAMNSDDTEIARLIKEAQKRRRGYADFFSWPPNRDMEETHAVALLAASMQKSGIRFFDQVKGRGRGNDPPDVEAVDSSGKRVAFEVTELVDEDAIHATRRGEPYPWAEWTLAKFQARIQYLLAQKASKATMLRGLPYDGGYVVLIYTDEPELRAERLASMLSQASFAAAGVSRAFLLLSYDPSTGGYPHFELPLAS